jgi:hypothetical protein
MRVASPSSRSTYILGVNDASIMEERNMKPLEKKSSANADRATVFLGVTLCALTLLGAGASAFPIDIPQDENESIPTVTRFVGGWKRTTSDPPTDNAYVFMLEGNQLRGTVRTAMRLKPVPGSGLEPRLIRDIHSPLPNLTVEGETLTWKFPLANDQVAHLRARLVSDDELLVENCGKQPCSPDRPAESKEILKRQK